MIKILLVDDEVDFLDSVTPALARRGFAVGQATDGRKALALLEQQSFDVIVLDVKMPGLDGVETFRRIKQLRPEIPVIMLTGHGTIQQAFEISREGVVEYLTKPCDVEKLVRVAQAAALHHVSPAPPSADACDEVIRVLLVDDEADYLASLRDALQRRKMQVSTAADGEAALASCSEREFDVVLADVRMPGMDGIALLRRIRQTHPTTQVIVLTGHPSMADAVEGLREGAFDFLRKPQSIENIARRIREAYRERGSPTADPLSKAETSGRRPVR
jgi:DNA-binding NtrC family response regulator